MKTKKTKHILLVLGVALFWACSTRKDSFVNRNFHAVTTEYNVLFNGDQALTKGVADVNASFIDDFWEILPVERMQLKEEELNPSQSKNPSFERAETKATKAIQKHSMNISGYEKNPQIDEAYLMLGKARYYEHRYFPAMEAFNYILYKYPNSNNAYQAKVWREKVNIRLENEKLAIKNLKKSLKDTKLKGKDLSDINAVLTEAYVKINALDSAVATIKIAKNETKVKEERARYTFILGQLYEKLNYKDSAYAAFQEVIDMKRKSPKSYTLFSHFKQAAQLDYTKTDTLVFLKKWDKMIEDIENKSYLDLLYHQKALFYDANKQFKQAVKFYTKSVKSFSNDKYLAASNYRNISTIYYNQHNFHLAKKYLDSTMIHLNVKHKEYRPLVSKLNVLKEVVKYQDIIKNADSILSISEMTDIEQKNYFRKYIVELKYKDSLKAIVNAQKDALKNTSNINGDDKAMQLPIMMDGDKSTALANKANLTSSNSVSSFNNQSSFYFYNAAVVAQGKLTFQKKWGNISLADNWKFSAKVDATQNNINSNDEVEQPETVEKEESNPAYTTQFYIDKLPKEAKQLADMRIDANDARFKLGELFKESLKENELATMSFEDVLTHKPESKLILPTYYNLYLLNRDVHAEKANFYKQKILTDYPNSRYASILSNGASFSEATADSEFNILYKMMKDGKIREAYNEVGALVKKYDGDELNAKFDVLKAQIDGRLLGINAYKSGLEKVVKDYPKGEESKRAAEILANDIPKVEAMNFGMPSKTFNLVFVTPYPNEVTYKDLWSKLTKYLKDAGNSDYSLSNDIYDLKTNCIVIHGFITEELASATYEYLKLEKDYKIKDRAYIISNEDYKVIQAKKKLEEFISKK